MSDGALLLRAVIEARARERAACAAFIDYFMDHLPAPGGTVNIATMRRTWGGAITASWRPLGGAPRLRIEGRRFRGVKGTRLMTTYIRPADSDAAQTLAALLTIFRS